MKRFLILFLSIIILNCLGIKTFANISEVTDQEKEIHKRIEPVLNILKRKNNLERNYIIVPVANVNKGFSAQKNGTIQFYTGALSVCDNDDLSAALLSMAIAKTEYGVVNKVFWKEFALGVLGRPWMHADVYTTDILGIEYMVKAGYNPIAMEALILRVGGDNSSWDEKWDVFPNATHRAEYVHKYIKTKYPKYLDEKYTSYYKNLIYIPCLENPNQNKLDVLPTKYEKRANKQYNKS